MSNTMWGVGVLLAVAVAHADSAVPPPSCAEIVRAIRDDDPNQTTGLGAALAKVARLPTAERRACLRVLLEKKELPEAVRNDEKHELEALYTEVAARDAQLADVGKRVATALYGMDADVLVSLVGARTALRIDGRGGGTVRGPRQMRAWVKADRWEGDVTIGLMLCDERCCDFFPGNERHEHHYYLKRLCFSSEKKLTQMKWERGR